MPQIAETGKYSGYLLEGMACPCGCIAGAGTIQPIQKTKALVDQYVADASLHDALDSQYELDLSTLAEGNF